MRQAVLVNGVPASGKSSVTARLSDFMTDRGLAAVPLGLDIVKEGLFGHLGVGDREHNRRFGRASYHVIFDIIANLPDQCVPIVDAWHGFQPVDVLEDHLARARIARTIEIWCAVSPNTAAERYRSRAADRKPGHPPASYADELRELVGRAAPLNIGPVLRTDTEMPFDPSICEELLTLLQTQKSDS